MALNLPLPQSRVPNYAQTPELFPVPSAVSTEPAPLDVVPVAPAPSVPPSPFSVVAPTEIDPIQASYAAMSAPPTAPVDPVVASYVALNPNVDTTPTMPPTLTSAPTAPAEPVVKSVPQQEVEGVPGNQGTGDSYRGVGLLPASEQRTGSMYPAGTEDNLRKAVDEQQKVMAAVKGIYERLDDESKPLFAKLAARSSDLESFLDPESEGYKAFAQKVNDVKSKMDTAHNDLAEFQKNAAVDPARFYKDTPFLQHAMNGIAMLMEAKTAGAMIRAGLPPPTGMIMSRIDKAINDDIARQKSEMASKEAGMTNTVNRYRDNLKMLGDERAAEFKTRAEMLQQIGTTIQATKAKFDGELNTANLDKALADTEANYVKATAEMGKWLVQQGFAAPTGQKESPEQAIRRQEKKVNVLGSEVDARTPEDAKALKDKTIATESVLSTLGELRKLREKSDIRDWAGLPTEDRARANFLVSSLHMNLKNAWGMGAFDKGTQDFLKGSIPNMDALSHVLDTYEAVEDSVISGYVDDLNQRTSNKYSLKSVRDTMLDQAKGKLEPRPGSKTGGGRPQPNQTPPPMPPVKMGTSAGSFGFGK